MVYFKIFFTPWRVSFCGVRGNILTTQQREHVAIYTLACAVIGT